MRDVDPRRQSGLQIHHWVRWGRADAQFVSSLRFDHGR
jgi:hypothetical protein